MNKLKKLNKLQKNLNTMLKENTRGFECDIDMDDDSLIKIILTSPSKIIEKEINLNDKISEKDIVNNLRDEIITYYKDDNITELNNIISENIEERLQSISLSDYFFIVVNSKDKNTLITKLYGAEKVLKAKIKFEKIDSIPKTVNKLWEKLDKKITKYFIEKDTVMEKIEPYIPSNIEDINKLDLYNYKNSTPPIYIKATLKNKDGKTFTKTLKISDINSEKYNITMDKINKCFENEPKAKVINVDNDLTIYELTNQDFAILLANKDKYAEIIMNKNIIVEKKTVSILPKDFDITKDIKELKDENIKHLYFTSTANNIRIVNDLVFDKGSEVSINNNENDYER